MGNIQQSHHQVITFMPLYRLASKVLTLDARTENPCVGGSIPPLGTILKAFLDAVLLAISQKSSGSHQN